MDSEKDFVKRVVTKQCAYEWHMSYSMFLLISRGDSVNFIVPKT